MEFIKIQCLSRHQLFIKSISKILFATVSSTSGNYITLILNKNLLLRNTDTNVNDGPHRKTTKER